MGSSRLFRSWRKKRKPVKAEEQSFLRNGALLLEKQVSFGGGNASPIKIFTAEEIRTAISANEFLGHGDFVTVYKGVVDEQIVVVKKHGENNYRELAEEVLNTVVIQSQVVHRNVVKVLGCCLETPIPCVVFEFMPNGSLSNYIFGGYKNRISWDKRLMIAIQIAEALSYLHTAGSRCIIHMDVKLANIFLDHHYNPKLSNFEISKLTTIGQRPVEKKIIGTFGHIDPEYASTGKVTEKSDVYSFGVVLVELLTGKMALQIASEGHETSDTEDDLDQPWEIDDTYTSIGAYLILHIQEKRLELILEAAVLEEAGMEQLEATAKLAVRCVQMKGEGRPTMKEVAQELKKIERMAGEPFVASI